MLPVSQSLFKEPVRLKTHLYVAKRNCDYADGNSIFVSFVEEVGSCPKVVWWFLANGENVLERSQMTDAIVSESCVPQRVRK